MSAYKLDQRAPVLEAIRHIDVAVAELSRSRAMVSLIERELGIGHPATVKLATALKAAEQAAEMLSLLATAIERAVRLVEGEIDPARRSS